MTLKVPAPLVIAKMMEGLFDRKVTVSPTSPTGAMPKPSVVALYESDAGAAQGVVACDLVLAAHAGAVLSLFPPGVAIDAIKSGKLPDHLLENWGEIVNILASSFNVEGVHVRLRQTTVVPSVPATRELTPYLKKFKAEFSVNIQGYATGRLLVSV